MVTQPVKGKKIMWNCVRITRKSLLDLGYPAFGLDFSKEKREKGSLRK